MGLPQRVLILKQVNLPAGSAVGSALGSKIGVNVVAAVTTGNTTQLKNTVKNAAISQGASLLNGAVGGNLIKSNGTINTSAALNKGAQLAGLGGVVNSNGKVNVGGVLNTISKKSNCGGYYSKCEYNGHDYEHCVFGECYWFDDKYFSRCWRVGSG